eukprot:gnl/MRDRNA2_/MRDRNA2_92502_c0_seq1.p1 gnl/MRDRNA2_/MRDRNA2_92502_c0~~gnl/MRDRNA2_/MRDRNA2_92502_c0_seq1.p1  ORF type:complete len:460 (+),score=129.67 gnl/MRDRNA2_/MRDRNA2_92502_c0_seq1:150-1529(+)
MSMYHAGRWFHLFAWLAVTSVLSVSSSPLPTVHQELAEGEDFDDIDAQQMASADGSFLPSSFFIGRSPDSSPDASPKTQDPQPQDLEAPSAPNVQDGQQPVEEAVDAQPTLPLPEEAKKDTKKAAIFRNKFRRIKNPIRRRNRIMLLLKAEMGKVQIAIEDLKDECHREKLQPNQCERRKQSLELSGKLRRIQSAYLSVAELGKEAEMIQDNEVHAQMDLRNATNYHTKAKTMLSGRMIALQDVEKRVEELKKEDSKNSVMQSKWEAKLQESWATMKNANSQLQAVEAFNTKFGAKLKGVLDGMTIADQNANADLDSAEEMEKKAELVEAHAKLLEDKADHIISDGRKSKGQGSSSSGSERSKVQYQENESGILASDSSFPLDSFGKARAHDKFGMQSAANFMAQRAPLALGKDELNKSSESHHNAFKEHIFVNKDSAQPIVGDATAAYANDEKYDEVN